MRHLTTRLVILLMLALMIITGAYDYTRLVRERSRFVEQTREDQRIFAETLALAVRQNLRRGRTTEELEELLNEIVTRPGFIAVTIFGPAGKVVAQNVASGAASPTVDKTVRETLATEEAVSALVTTDSVQMLRYVQPFRWPGGQAGAIEVQQTLEEVDRKFRHEIRERVVSRLGLLVAFVLSIVALTRWSIARPIRAVIQGARAVGRGDLTQQVQLGRRDEIGQLADEFNRMASNLQAARQEIFRQAEERLRLEQEVQQVQRLAAVGMLATEVAHEIGTPLNIISGRTEMLDRVIPRDHPERRHLDVVLKQTERISGIIRSLLDYARPQRPMLRQEELLPILARVADLLLGRCRAKQVRIQLDLPVGLPPILGDADRLQQLFLNLLVNALDASPAAGTIRVTTGPDPVLPDEDRIGIVPGKAEGPCLAIHIVDRGKGIPPEQLDQIFQPFFSTKRRGQGTGMGLPIVEEIVRAHRGEIEILSIPENGTEAIVRLPFASSIAVGREAAGEAPAPTVGEHGR